VTATYARDISVEEAGLALTDPAAYADGRLELACAVLRRDDPVHRVEAPGFAPFHALCKHADILEVERHPQRFVAAPRYKLVPDEYGLGQETGRALVAMDPPEHTEYRGLVADWFHSKAIALLDERIHELARASVDDMATRDDAYDFVTEIAMQLPLSVICSMLGIPREDGAFILAVTQQIFGSYDPEYQARLAAGDREAAAGFGPYFAQVVQDRLADPTDDLSSVLTHAKLDGEPLPPRDLFGYFGILATAGHDTTSSAIAGGLLTLVQHPDQLDRLRADPSLVPTAVEEILRWITPVKSFMRTATEDTEIRGRRIATGESVMLVYPSANRDEDVFDEPERFDVGRDPNRHLAFGTGVHFCLGAQLARLETRGFFAALVPRLRSIELAGEPQLVRTLLVGGLKHLPIHTEIGPHE
jgi:cytochrome P450